MITTLCRYRLPAANMLHSCNADCAMRCDAIPLLLTAKGGRRKCGSWKLVVGWRLIIKAYMDIHMYVCTYVLHARTSQVSGLLLLQTGAAAMAIHTFLILCAQSAISHSTWEGLLCKFNELRTHRYNMRRSVATHVGMHTCVYTYIHVHMFACSSCLKYARTTVQKRKWSIARKRTQ